MSQALAVALALGTRHGLPIDSPVVLHDGSNLLVRLAPAPWLQREVDVAS